MTKLLIKLFIKNGGDTKCGDVRARYGTLGSIVGICANVLLCAIKITVGLIGNSISIIADGLNNLSDMGSSVITMLGFKLANKPADRDHPFGHGRMEYMSAFIVAALILIVGFEMLGTSFKSLISGDAAPVYSIVSIIALIVSILIKLWLYIFNKHLSKITDSSALLATAKDSLNDCISTSAILLAAIITTYIELPFNLDALMAMGVSIFILYAGYSTAKDTIDEILGKPPEAELIKDIENGIMSFEGFIGIHDLIVHNYGPGRQFASVHVEVPHDIDIVKCHEQIDICEKLVGEKTGVELVIHMDPIDVNSEAVCIAREHMNEVIRDIDSHLTLHDFRMTPVSDTRTNLIFDVVVPPECTLTPAELDNAIAEAAKQKNPTYVCVVTYDNSFIG